MDLAVITEKYGDGRSKTIRATGPMSADLRTQAERLDSRLHREVRQLEARLADEGLLGEAGGQADAAKSKGSAALWYEVGVELGRLAMEASVKGVRERRWIWEAIENLHATDRIKRASRGRTRTHFEYCYRLAQFPREIAVSMNWSEWVYFFDSLTVREEPRADEWLRDRIWSARVLDRRSFRRFTENLNRRIRKMDTSVLSKQELFELYDQLWKSTVRDLQSNPPSGRR
jgi:hypothetical protein